MKYRCKLDGNAGVSSRWQEAISENFIVIPFSHYNMGVTKLLLHSGVDLGFTERITLSIESLKQGVWGGTAPQKL